MKTLPIPSKELLEWLDRLYPAFNPSPSMNPNVVMYRAGQRDVVEGLRRMAEAREAQLSLTV